MPASSLGRLLLVLGRPRWSRWLASGSVVERSRACDLGPIATALIDELDV